VLDTVPAAWGWLVFGPEGRTLYASGGQHRNRQTANTAAADSGPRLGEAWPRQKIGVAGLAVDRRGLLCRDASESNSLYTFELKIPALVAAPSKLPADLRRQFQPRRQPVLHRVLGAHTVAAYDRSTALLANIPVATQRPGSVSDGRLPFVANANNSNSVSVIDTRAGRVVETPQHGPVCRFAHGSTPNGLVSGPTTTASSTSPTDNNCLAVFDVPPVASKSLASAPPAGKFPRGKGVAGGHCWWPTAKVARGPTPNGPTPCAIGRERRRLHREYCCAVRSRAPPPSGCGGALEGVSAQVYANTPYTKAEASPDVPAGNPVRLSTWTPRPSSTSLHQGKTGPTTRCSRHARWQRRRQPVPVSQQCDAQPPRAGVRVRSIILRRRRGER
jgi:hypothetical protein